LVALVIILRRRWYGPSELKEQNRFLIALLALFLLSLLPVINLRLTLYQTLGERFLYLPSVFSCLLMAYLAAILLRRQTLWLTILICVLGFYSVRLYQTNRSWSEAAKLSRSITNDLADSSTHDRLLVLNAPDNLGGVPVFHNGLPEALLYFQNRTRFKQVEIIGFQDLQSVQDEVAVSRSPDSLSIHLLNINDSFIRVEPSDCLETTNQSRTSLEVHIKPCATDTDLFLFDKGRMSRLPDR
jgi:hypothetical protein